MHTLLNHVVSRGREETLRRTKYIFFQHRNRFVSENSFYASFVQNQRRELFRGRSRDELHRPSGASFPKLHTTTKSLAPHGTAIHNEEEENAFGDNLDKEIELLTSSCLSQFMPHSLPEEIFYQNGEEPLSQDYDNSLDQELGNDSVWDSSTEEIINPVKREQRSTIANFPDGSDQTKNSAMEILRNFDDENRPPIEDKEELQLWLECAAQREAVMKYQRLVENARDRKAFDSMSLMQRHVVQWYQDLRDAIEMRQKEYLSNEDSRRARKRYGPFLCSLNPEKMAVITSHEAVTQALLLSGKNGNEGVPLVKLAQFVGAAVETEVISQRRMKERFHGTSPPYESNKSDDDDNNDTTEASKGPKMTAIDHWKFSASHLKMYMDELKRINPNGGKGKRAINYAMRRAKQAMNTDQKWSREDLTHIGAALHSILIENAKVYQNGTEEPAFRVEKKWSKNSKSTSYVVLNDHLSKLFLEDEFLSWAANTTRHKPMIVPPSDWIGPNDGGYRWLKVELMRTHRSNVQREVLEHGDLSLVADGLNILGKTPWQINKKILEVGEHCWENNIPIGDIPSRTDFEVPPEPIRPRRIDEEQYANKESPETQAAMEANRAYRESMYKRQRIHQKNMDLRSLRCSATLKLNQAKEFQDFEKIYFPYNLDFRGRACEFFFLNVFDFCCLYKRSHPNFYSLRSNTSASLKRRIRSLPWNAYFCRSQTSWKARTLLAESSPCKLCGKG